MGQRGGRPGDRGFRGLPPRCGDRAVGPFRHVRRHRPPQGAGRFHLGVSVRPIAGRQVGAPAPSLRAGRLCPFGKRFHHGGDPGRGEPYF